MAIRTKFRPFIATIAVCLVPACAPGEDGSTATEEAAPDDTTADNGSAQEALLMADTAWLSVGSDGAVQTTFFDPDGRYRDLRNGQPMDAGTWQQRPDGSICFTPDTGLGDCWNHGKLEEDGSTVVTSASGKRVEIRQITYAGPPLLETESTESQ
jgi:hypothetical protein